MAVQVIMHMTAALILGMMRVHILMAVMIRMLVHVFETALHLATSCVTIVCFIALRLTREVLSGREPMMLPCWFVAHVGDAPEVLGTTFILVGALGTVGDGVAMVPATACVCALSTPVEVTAVTAK